MKGHVLDITTGLPVAGAWVELDGEQGGFFVPTIYETAGKTITDATGAFDFEYRKRRIAGYTIYAGADNYFFDPSQDYVDVDFSTHNKVEIKLIPKATLVFDIRNTKGGGGVSYRTFNTRTNQTTTSTGTGSHKFPIDVEGNKEIQIRYYITPQTGQEMRYDTTMYCPSFKTTTLLIEF